MERDKAMTKSYRDDDMSYEAAFARAAAKRDKGVPVIQTPEGRPSNWLELLDREDYEIWVEEGRPGAA